MKHYADLMNDTEAELLQEAGTDVAYLTTQGYSPTEAIAKVAAAARFPVEKTNLLTYAYTNGMAAEKRSSLGGPFERLAEFEMPDPDRIRKLVYGEQEKEADFLPKSFGPNDSVSEPEHKTASISNDLPRFDMSLFDTDPSRLNHEAQRALFGLPGKTASKDDDTDENGKPVGKGFLFSQTTISIGLGSPCRSDHDSEDSVPKSLHDFMRRKIGTLTPEMSGDLETTLLKMLGEKKAAMTEANAEADDAFAQVCDSLDTFGSKIRHRHFDPTFKRAGLLSVNAYYPDIASMLGPYTDEVNGYLIKNASHGPVDINAYHPWVVEAGRIQKALATVADLTVEANRKSAEYVAVRTLYKKRDTLRKSADWSSFLAGSLMPGAGSTAKDLVMGSDQSRQKATIRSQMLDELDDKMHDLTLRDINLQSNLSDYDVNDDVLKAFGKTNLISAANDLLPTAPNTMRNRAVGKALLQQYLSQGERLALTEYEPALKINKLDPRKESFHKTEKKKDDDEQI